MFTGIVEKRARIKGVSHRKDTYRLEVLTEERLGFVKEGDSLSVNGTCLTLVGIKKEALSFDIMAETFQKTSFPYLKHGDVVNIERSLEWKSRIEGHFVSGHIDSVQKIKEIRKDNKPYLDVSTAKDDTKYLVKKGSVAIDGISLTVGELYEDRIRVHIIPYTLQNTNLKFKKKGDAVNLEFDILGKYILNRALYGRDKPASLTEEFLKNKGFI